tara:strand:+ start:104 stop:415 length:312 start_codon:yes stop_codon:yes gene_type:complete
MYFKLGEVVGVTLGGKDLGTHEIVGVISKGSNSYRDPLSGKMAYIYGVLDCNGYLLDGLIEPLERAGSLSYRLFAETQIKKIHKKGMGFTELIQEISGKHLTA